MTNDYPGPGYIYLRNVTTGEIHREDVAGRSHEQCMDDLLPEHREELRTYDALRLVAADDTRRCGHCWPADEARNVVPT